ncbi:hypothetical protein ACOME3_001031 [Neoechinorhynchus agilis]
MISKITYNEAAFGTASMGELLATLRINVINDYEFKDARIVAKLLKEMIKRDISECDVSVFKMLQYLKVLVGNTENNTIRRLLRELVEKLQDEKDGVKSTTKWIIGADKPGGVSIKTRAQVDAERKLKAALEVPLPDEGGASKSKKRATAPAPKQYKIDESIRQALRCPIPSNKESTVFCCTRSTNEFPVNFQRNAVEQKPIPVNHNMRTIQPASMVPNSGFVRPNEPINSMKRSNYENAARCGTLMAKRPHIEAGTASRIPNIEVIGNPRNGSDSHYRRQFAPNIQYPVAQTTPAFTSVMADSQFVEPVRIPNPSGPILTRYPPSTHEPDRQLRSPPPDRHYPNSKIIESSTTSTITKRPITAELSGNLDTDQHLEQSLAKNNQDPPDPVTLTTEQLQSDPAKLAQTLRKIARYLLGREIFNKNSYRFPPYRWSRGNVPATVPTNQSDLRATISNQTSQLNTDSSVQETTQEKKRPLPSDDRPSKIAKREPQSD